MDFETVIDDVVNGLKMPVGGRSSKALPNKTPSRDFDEVQVVPTGAF